MLQMRNCTAQHKGLTFIEMNAYICASNTFKNNQSIYEKDQIRMLNFKNRLKM